MTYQIRSYQPKDAAAIAEIFAYYVCHTTISFAETAPDAAQTAALAEDIRALSPYFVAELEGEVMGYAYAKPWGKMAGFARTYESTIYLRHSRDKALCKGMGEALYKALIEGIAAQGKIRSLYGVVVADNLPSNRLHEKLGFTKAAVLTDIGYKHGQWLDLWYWRYDFY